MSECEYARRLSAYHDGEVSDADRASLEAHVRQCPACAAELRRLAALSHMVSRLGLPKMPAQSVERVRRATDAMLMADLGRMAKRFLAAAAAVLLVCSVWLWRSEAAPRPAERMPLWETAVATQQATLATGSEEQLAQWIALDLERKNGHD